MVIGNTHQLRRHPPHASRRNSDDFASNHSWGFFVEVQHPDGSIDLHPDTFIERVLVRLHHSFNPSLLALSSPPFEIQRVGWGRFNVNVMITFKSEWNKDPIMLDWMLDFTREKSSMSTPLTFSRAGLGDLGGGGGGGDTGAAVTTPAYEDWRTMLEQAVTSDDDEDWEPPDWVGSDLDMEMIEFNEFLNAVGGEEDE